MARGIPGILEIPLNFVVSRNFAKQTKRKKFDRAPNKPNMPRGIGVYCSKFEQN